ncbi:hypothetical protein GUJ93_ZPchr0136g33680 [Zizania palustris]|uniref:Uncharacterized protein n=1 Tax=Zizania palustris TaxID=103762 RepID=A0A8J5UV98_ZIZPA|nr:hypothetical protein GUJ93_ZPchr0136g33680 [Zizania palustris]
MGKTGEGAGLGLDRPAPGVDRVTVSWTVARGPTRTRDSGWRAQAATEREEGKPGRHRPPPSHAGQATHVASRQPALHLQTPAWQLW